jgi:hypothetical protein
MDNRAALAFLIGGPVTAIPAMVLLWSMFKKRVFVLYMSISLLGTIFFAYTIGNLLFISHVDTDNPLLVKVSTLTGGESAIISKTSDFVRVAADPDRKPIIACYEDLEGGSGIVFDASWNRFINGSLSLEGNRQYIRNIARWLDKTSLNPGNNRILIYNTYVDRGLNNEAVREGLESILTEHGEFQIDFFARNIMPRLTGSALEGYGQLWILSGQPNSRSFSDQEIQDICAFRNEGNGLLIVAGPDNGSSGDWTAAANQVAENYNVKFDGAATFQEKIPVSVLTHLSTSVSQELLSYFDWLKRLRS